MLVSIIACAQFPPVVQLTEQEVACQPAGDWLHRFPAISRHNDEIAVLAEPNSESGIVSLHVLRIQGQELQLELEFPLSGSEYVNWKECIEEVDAGTRESDIGSLEIITAVNTHLSDNRFIEMFPLDARSIYGFTMNTLPSEPEDVISWGHFHILVDYRQGKLTISEILGDDEGGVLATTDHKVGERYFDLQLSRKEESGDTGAAELCVGIPVPLAVWTNRGWEVPDDAMFLIRIGYVSSGDCEFPDEWFVKVVEP